MAVLIWLIQVLIDLDVSITEVDMQQMCSMGESVNQTNFDKVKYGNCWFDPKIYFKCRITCVQNFFFLYVNKGS